MDIFIFHIRNLHSSMVRLESQYQKKDLEKLQDLHSSMVRLERGSKSTLEPLILRFTFQYG